MRDEACPPAGPHGLEPLVEGETGQPGADERRPHRRCAEDVVAPVVRTAPQPVGEQHAEEGDEERAEQVEEPSVLHEVDHEHACSGERCDRDDQEPLRGAREEILKRHRGRVHIRERLLRLVHDERKQSQARECASARDRGHDAGRVGKTAREEQERAEPVQPDVRYEVADSGSGE